MNVKIIDLQIYEKVLARLITVNAITPILPDYFTPLTTEAMVRHWYMVNELTYMQAYSNEVATGTRPVLYESLRLDEKAQPINVYELLVYCEAIQENVRPNEIRRFSIPDHCEDSIVHLRNIIADLKTSIVHSLPMYSKVEKP
jgi:hypothetical protein